MKTRNAIIILFAFLAACKKDKHDDNQPKTILLSATFVNGHVSTRFNYSSDNKLTGMDAYGELAPNALTASIALKYDQAGNFNGYTTYTEPGHAAALRLVVDSTSNGHLAKASQYDLQSATPNTPIATLTHTYNAQGRLSKVENRDKSGKLVTSTNISYYADGSVKQTDTYKEANNLLYLVEKRIYAIPGAIVPKGLKPIEEVFGFDYTASFVNEAYQQYSYDQNGAVTNNRQYQFSGREYAADSALTRQTVTIKFIKPPFPDEVQYRQYEYITR